MKEVIIIGAGLSGLTIAFLLKKQNIPFFILEAQPAIGGRIDTQKGQSGVPIDLGATWFGDQHTQLLELISELKLNCFHQHTAGKAIFQTHSFQPPQVFEVPEGEQSSYRLQGGTMALITKLAQKTEEENILTNRKITQITEQDNSLQLTDANRTKYTAQKIITTLPPAVLNHSIQFEPALPEGLQQLLPRVQTWMNGSIKFALEYEEPFWLNHGFSGTLFSQSSLAVEVYDHSNAENNRFSLMGFLNGSATNYSREQRAAMVTAQMKQLFGAIATPPLAYHEKVWNSKFVTSPAAMPLTAHQNNGHGLLQKAWMNEKLYFAGTETATIHPGYMEGAVRSAYRVVKQITAP